MSSIALFCSLANPKPGDRPSSSLPANHSPAFAGKEYNRLLNSHFTDQSAVERSTLSEITSASASELEVEEIASRDGFCD
jgi:hypothetical protein